MKTDKKIEEIVFNIQIEDTKLKDWSLLEDEKIGLDNAIKEINTEVQKAVEDDRFNIWKDISCNGSITDEEYLEHYLPEYKKKWEVIGKHLQSLDKGDKDVL